MKKKIALCLVFILCILSAVVGREKMVLIQNMKTRRMGTAVGLLRSMWEQLKKQMLMRKCKNFLHLFIG